MQAEETGESLRRRHGSTLSSIPAAGNQTNSPVTLSSLMRSAKRAFHGIRRILPPQEASLARRRPSRESSTSSLASMTVIIPGTVSFSSVSRTCSRTESNHEYALRVSVFRRVVKWNHILRVGKDSIAGKIIKTALLARRTQNVHV